MRRRVLTHDRLRRPLPALLSTALVAALLATMTAAIGSGQRESTAPAAAEPAPGRIAYTADDQAHRTLALVGTGRPTALLDGGRAGDDCQPAVRGDTVVWVSTRSGTGESLLLRQGAGPVKVLLERQGWRIKHPALSPDGAWVAFTSWQGNPAGTDLSEDWCRQTAAADQAAGSGSDDLTPSVWVARTDGSGLRRVAVGGGWASWSPDGGALAYEQAGKIFRIPVAPGGTAVRVDTGTGEAHRPAWEPQAGAGHDRIAFITAADGYRQLALVPARGGGAAQPIARGAKDPAATEDVSWSPDGASLAFLSTDLFRVDPASTCPTCPGAKVDVSSFDGVESAGWYASAGGAPMILTTALTYGSRIEGVHPAPPLDRLDLRPQTDWRETTADPAYSPDGRRLAHTLSVFGPDGRVPTRILVGDAADPTRATVLAGPGVDQDREQSAPAWSPDGKKLAFVQQNPCSECNAEQRIVVVDLTDGVDKAKPVLTVPPRAESGSRCTSRDFDPAWSPDGSRLAFSRESDCTPIIKLTAAEAAPAPDTVYGIRHLWSAETGAGGDQRDLTAAQCGDPKCPVRDARPAYAPDGSGLAFGRRLLAARPDPSPSPTHTSPSPTPPPCLDGCLRTGPTPARTPLWVVLKLGADGRACRSLVPSAASCPNVGPVNGTPLPDGPLRQPADPAWSPDGKQLALDVEVGGDRPGLAVAPRRIPSTYRRIAVVDPATGTGRTLPVRAGASHTRPSWQPTADLAVSLTPAHPRISRGGTTELTLTVTNLGPGYARGVTAEPALPAGLQAVGAPVPSQGSCPPAPYRCALGGLAAGAGATVRITVKGVTAGAQQATAQVGADALDPRAENDRAEAVITVLAPDLVVTASAKPATAAPGEPITVTFTVRNQGDGTAAGVTLTPVVPPQLRVVSATPACPSTGCPLGDLRPKDEATATLVLAGDTAFTGQVTGTVTSANGEPVTAGAAVTVTAPAPTATPTTAPPPTATPTTAPPPTATPTTTTPPDDRLPDLAVSATAAPALIRTGQQATVTLTVRNGGAVPAPGAALALTLPAGLRLDSATPACPAGRCPLGPLDPGGSATVTLAVTGLTAGNATVSGTATADRGTAATAATTLTVLQPTLLLDPKVGPPGIVTLAHGSQFPPGTTVRLRWSAGVTADTAPVVVAADGTFTAPALVLVQDTLGPRELVATLPDLPAFGEVRSPFTVVPGVLQPRPYEERR
ncbi:CARDB domain-containing protein [Kitasatospora sp. NPDC094028]